LSILEASCNANAEEFKLVASMHHQIAQVHYRFSAGHTDIEAFMQTVTLSRKPQHVLA
jgi:hypothetical protein